MRKIALVLMLALPLAAKVKQKQKEFLPVPVQDVQTIAGRYVGIERDVFIDIAVGAKGSVAASLHQFGVVTALQNVTIEGAQMRSSALHATFVDRVKNGEHAFGLMLRDVNFRYDGLLLTNLFCRKQ
jgi:hypothetical protein